MLNSIIPNRFVCLHWIRIFFYRLTTCQLWSHTHIYIFALTDTKSKFLNICLWLGFMVLRACASRACVYHSLTTRKSYQWDSDVAKPPTYNQFIKKNFAYAKLVKGMFVVLQYIIMRYPIWKRLKRKEIGNYAFNL